MVIAAGAACEALDAGPITSNAKAASASDGSGSSRPISGCRSGPTFQRLLDVGQRQEPTVGWSAMKDRSQSMLQGSRLRET